MGQPNSGPTSKELGKAAQKRRARLAGAHQERMERECQASEHLAEPAGESPAGMARESPAGAGKGTPGGAGRSAPGQAGALEQSRPR